MSKFRNSRFLSVYILGTLSVSAAQADWREICPPPGTPPGNPFSDDASWQAIANPLFAVSMGVSGTSAWAAGCF